MTGAPEIVEGTRAVPRQVVLLAHGSRDPRWRRPFEQLLQRTRAAGGPPVRLAYLQLCEPGLERALARCRDDGAREVLVVPVFMSGGGHLLRDVPGQVARAAAAVGGLRVSTTGALGEEREVVAAMASAVARLAG